MPKPLIWHSGPPPHIGWWNASMNRQISIWRWWDGNCWSDFVQPSDSLMVVALTASIKHNFGNIEWNQSYPENPRVPRINPKSKGECLNKQACAKTDANGVFHDCCFPECLS